MTIVSSQVNKTEENNPKKWYAVSTLEYTFHKGHNGKTLRCVAVHEAYPTRSRETQVVMDVQCKSKFYLHIQVIVSYISYEWIGEDLIRVPTFYGWGE